MNTTYIVAALLALTVVGYVVLGVAGHPKEAENLVMVAFFLTMLYGFFRLLVS